MHLILIINASKSLFQKNRSYPALVYYSVNNHMCWLSHKDKVESLIKSAREMEVNIHYDPNF